MVSALDLPDELWIEVFDFLDAKELIAIQRVSQRLLKLSRDTSLWRNKCFENTSAASIRSQRRNNNFWNSLDRLALRQSDGSTNATPIPNSGRPNNRARAIADWDCTHPSEKIDWYSEYVARHAPLSTDWLSHEKDNEIRSLALFDKDKKILSATEDGSLRIYEINRISNGRRSITESARSQDFLLVPEWGSSANASKRAEQMVGSAVESTVVDSHTMKAYVAVNDILNEVDLGSMKLIAQTKYPWRITAISQQVHNPCPVPLMVGTSYSLEMHDPRLGLDMRRSETELDDLTQLSEPVERIAVFPNSPHYVANARAPSSSFFGPRISAGISGGSTTRPAGLWSNMRPVLSVPGSTQFPPPNRNIFASPSVSHNRNEIVRPPTLESWLAARLEPGPQAILHRGPHEVIIAGRMPSILFYDTRHFPRISHVLHSGARLSSLTTIPCPPYGIHKDSLAEATLVAGGEYHGRGSLELYELASSKHIGAPRSPSMTSVTRLESEAFPLSSSFPQARPLHMSTAETPTTLAADVAYEPRSYKNRQSSSSAKLLSVVTQGTRIVFSDSEGALKWVERDGQTLARRWNVNNYEYGVGGASLSGDRVARKILTFAEDDKAGMSGKRGDGDLLVWTGSDLGIVTNKVKWDNHLELVDRVDGSLKPGSGGSDEDQAEEYARVMRKALERQADERRWMSRFGGRWR